MRELPGDDFLSGQSFRSGGLAGNLPTPVAKSPAPAPKPKEVSPGIFQGTDGRLSTNVPLPKFAPENASMMAADVPGLRFLAELRDRYANGVRRWGSIKESNGMHRLTLLTATNRACFELPPIVCEEVRRMLMGINLNNSPTIDEVVVACLLAQYRI